MTETISKAFTHGGKFHADDVFSAALLRYLFPDIVIQRGFEVPEDFDGIVFDIGFGEFDHHQENKRLRENGIAYAAFGLLWDRFGKEILGEDAEKFDETFVQPLDINDNTGEFHELASIIGLFNPAWDSTDDPNEAFEEAVQFASKILTLKFDRMFSIGRAKEVVQKTMEQQQDGIMILEVGAPWKQQVANTDIEFVIAPSQRGGFNAQAVEKEDGSRELKYPFLEEWRGKTKEELPVISGIETLHFCHNSGFLAATKTLEDAIKACKLSKNATILTEN